jgi:asparagine synthase (glutamine-hydrolysing)
VLGGQGGDEIFGGYTRYLVAYFEECLRGGIEGTQEDEKYVVTFDSILENLPQLNGYQPMLQYFWQDGLFESPDLRYFRLIDRSQMARNYMSEEVITGDNGYSPFACYRDLFNSGNIGSYINRMTHFDLKTLLPALLQVEDRTSMAVSLESRVPLLDYRIAELVASMPPKIKYKGGRSKHIFRKVVQPMIPQEIFNRKDKMGFPVPLDEWYQQEPVHSFVLDTLMSLRARQRGYLENVQIERLLRSENTFGRNIWGLLCLELWMQAYLDGQQRNLATV